MRYRGYGLPMGEVVPEGNLGLMHANGLLAPTVIDGMRPAASMFATFRRKSAAIAWRRAAWRRCSSPAAPTEGRSLRFGRGDRVWLTTKGPEGRLPVGAPSFMQEGGTC